MVGPEERSAHRESARAASYGLSLHDCTTPIVLSMPTSVRYPLTDAAGSILIGRMTHRRDLDGLRAIAALLVLGFHFDIKPLWLGGWIGGWLGVGLFFGLSGYLITTLLVRERERTGRIDIPAFWLRRFARVVPAAILPAVYVLTAEWLFTGSPASFAWLLPWSNLIMTNGNLGHYWSISIELQFYLVIPLVVVLYRPSPWAFLVGAYALTFLFPPDVLGYGTLQRIAPFLIGATIARSGLPTMTLPIGWLAPIGVISYGLYLWHYPLFSLFGRTPAVLVSVFVAALMSYRYIEQPFIRWAAKHSSADPDDAPVPVVARPPMVV
jgi:peptidoglycan/LPS O-acetylase OafA/YrhL